MNPDDRVQACHNLAADKCRMGLCLEDVRRIDAYLAERWDITVPLPPHQWENRLAELAGEALAKKYWDLHDEMASRYADSIPVPMKLETDFYNVLADDRISGHVHSQKRPEILDAGCLLVHLVRELGIDGPILDVGCHVGYHAELLARETSATVRGIDVCSDAIEVAAAKTSGTPRLAFAVGSLAQQSLNEQYALVYAVRSISLNKIAARQISEALKPGGVAVILEWGAPDPSQRTRKAIREARLGWGFSDVVGGWVGEGREDEAGPVVVLIKDGSLGIPADFIEQAKATWNDHFKHYANSAGTPRSEKTQAYFRGWYRKQRKA